MPIYIETPGTDYGLRNEAKLAMQTGHRDAAGNGPMRLVMLSNRSKASYEGNFISFILGTSNEITRTMHCTSMRLIAVDCSFPSTFVLRR